MVANWLAHKWRKLFLLPITLLCKRIALVHPHPALVRAQRSLLRRGNERENNQPLFRAFSSLLSLSLSFVQFSLFLVVCHCVSLSCRVPLCFSSSLSSFFFLCLYSNSLSHPSLSSFFLSVLPHLSPDPPFLPWLSLSSFDFLPRCRFFSFFSCCFDFLSFFCLNFFLFCFSFWNFFVLPLCFQLSFSFLERRENEDVCVLGEEVTQEGETEAEIRHMPAMKREMEKEWQGEHERNEEDRQKASCSAKDQASRAQSKVEKRKNRELRRKTLASDTRAKKNRWRDRTREKRKKAKVKKRSNSNGKEDNVAAEREKEERESQIRNCALSVTQQSLWSVRNICHWLFFCFLTLEGWAMAESSMSETKDGTGAVPVGGSFISAAGLRFLWTRRRWRCARGGGGNSWREQRQRKSKGRRRWLSARIRGGRGWRIQGTRRSRNLLLSPLLLLRLLLLHKSFGFGFARGSQPWPLFAS